MCSFEELNAIAKHLIRDEPFFARHNILCLQAFIRDGGRCRYCDRDLFESYDTASATDHLLPRSRYPALEWDPLNLVASCSECNHTKSDWNPAGNEDYTDLTEDLRERLIAAASAYIKERKKTPDFRSMFPRARTRFQEAVAQHRKACVSCAKEN
jgi:hypothetical protein